MPKQPKKGPRKAPPGPKESDPPQSEEITPACLKCERCGHENPLDADACEGNGGRCRFPLLDYRTQVPVVEAKRVRCPYCDGRDLICYGTAGPKLSYYRCRRCVYPDGSGDFTRFQVLWLDEPEPELEVAIEPDTKTEPKK